MYTTLIQPFAQSSPFGVGDQSFAHQDCNTGCEVQAEGVRREITTYRVLQDYEMSVVAHCNAHARNIVCVNGYCLSTVTWLCSLLCSTLPYTESRETTLSKDCWGQLGTSVCLKEVQLEVAGSVCPCGS